MLRALSILTLFALGLAAGAWFVFGGEPVDALAPAGPTDPARASGPARPAAGVPLAPETDAARTAAPGPSPAAPETAEDMAPTGASLLVRVLDHGTGAPLEGFVLRVASYEAETEPLVLVTGADGRARSAAVVPRGLIDLDHAPAEDPTAPFGVPWEVLTSSALVDAEPGETLEFQVRARGPRLTVRAAVLDQNGERVVNCEVFLVQGAVLEDGNPWWHFWRRAATDASGVATFSLHDEAVLAVPFALLLAEPFGSQVSDVLYIDPPTLPTLHTLHLYPGGELVVQVLDPEGIPAEGAAVGVALDEPLRARRGERLTTGADGQGRFSPLAAGRHRVSVEAPGSHGQTVAQGAVEVERGARAVLTLRLPDTASLELVVAGRVLGPEDEPVAEGFLLVACDGEDPQRVRLGPDGTFELRRSEPCTTVTVSAAVSVYSAPIDPEEVRVPAGTRDLVFRTSPGPELARVFFEIVDARTGAPPSDDETAIVIYREPREGARVTARAFFGPDTGTTEIDFPPSPLRWVVHCPGYEEARGELPSPRPGEPPPIVRVTLHAGFRRALVVRDAQTGARLAGVAFRDGEGRALGVTGSDGGVVLSAPAWPRALALERAGWESLEWDARRHWNNWSHQIWLRPVR